MHCRVQIFFINLLSVVAAAEQSCFADDDGVAGCVLSATASAQASAPAKPTVVKEQLLLQRLTDIKVHRSTNPGGDLVRDEPGDFPGEDLEDVVGSECAPSQVRRRRREATEICACRRRDSGRQEDGGWRCQGDTMVQASPQWTNPVWADEFDGDGEYNSSLWTHTTSGSGNGNNELQYYTGRPSNLRVEGGVLKIVGKRESYGGKGYTSAKLTSKGLGDWGPGHRLEIRAKLPTGVGTWPALWMMPTESNYGDWPNCGELDIMECIGRSPGKVFGTVHTGAYNHMQGTHKGRSFYTDFSEWHTYSVVWEDSQIKWYADGNLYNTFAPDDTQNYAQWPFNRRFYLLLNLAIGGTLGGSVHFDADQLMEIDYVRVYCLDGTLSCKTLPVTCCSKCAGGQFCSQRSGNCYDSKRQDYYESCGGAERGGVEPIAPGCCAQCAGGSFCSPVSGNCYDSQAKDYYESCPAAAAL
jgi:beta-glucanase (GH16 family)